MSNEKNSSAGLSREEIIDQHPRGFPLTPGGAEVLDSTPMSPPLGYKRQPSLSEQIREMVRNEKLAAELAAAGHETFDEADDFDIEDDIDPTSPWENDFDPPVAELRKREKAEKARLAAEAAASQEPKQTSSPPDQGGVVKAPKAQPGAAGKAPEEPSTPA